jgi:hypothetical protein
VGGISFLTLLSIASCDTARRIPETGATLEGSVTYKGEPIYYALVIVQGQNASAQGQVDDNGRYSLANVPLGEVKIAVNTPAGKGKFMSQSMAANAAKDGAKPKNFVDVPAKWHSPTTSGLTKTIEPGVNKLDIDIPAK